MLKHYLKQILALLSRDWVLTSLLVLATTYFLIYYLTDPKLPSGVLIALLGLRDNAQYPLGWFGYYDQSQYLSMANTLANFNFGQLHHTFTFGLGYPLVAVPALWLGLNTDPFMPFNLFVFVFITYAVYQSTKRLISPLAGWIAGFGLVFATPLIHYVDQPWNSTVCLLAIAGVLLVASHKKVSLWSACALGFLIGWSFAARYIDVIWLLPLATASMYRGSLRRLIVPIMIMGIGLTLWVVPVLYSHYRIFGSPLRTPYVNHLGLNGSVVSDQGAGAYSLGRVPKAALGMFVSPRWAGSQDQDRGWLLSMFWVIAAIPGFILLLRRKSNKLFWSILVGATIVAYVFYLSFRASGPDALKYGTLHYFKMFWPGVIVLASVFFDTIIQKAIKQTLQHKTKH